MKTPPLGVIETNIENTTAFGENLIPKYLSRNPRVITYVFGRYDLPRSAYGPRGTGTTLKLGRGANISRGPRQTLHKTKNSSDLAHYFFGMAQVNVQKTKINHSPKLGGRRPTASKLGRKVAPLPPPPPIPVSLQGPHVPRYQERPRGTRSH